MQCIKFLRDDQSHVTSIVKMLVVRKNELLRDEQNSAGRHAVVPGSRPNVDPDDGQNITCVEGVKVGAPPL